MDEDYKFLGAVKFSSQILLFRVEHLIFFKGLKIWKFSFIKFDKNRTYISQFCSPPPLPSHNDNKWKRIVLSQLISSSQVRFIASNAIKVISSILFAFHVRGNTKREKRRNIPRINRTMKPFTRSLAAQLLNYPSAFFLFSSYLWLIIFLYVR